MSGKPKTGRLQITLHECIKLFNTFVMGVVPFLSPSLLPVLTLTH
jgi:hypothetical protein